MRLNATIKALLAQLVPAFLRPGGSMNASSNSEGRRPACWPMSYHLIVLTLAVMVPLLGLAGISLRNSFKAERETVDRSAQQIVDGVMARIDREVLSAITILNVLGNDKAFDRGEYMLLYDRARDALQGRQQHIVLTRPDNSVIFNTSVPLDTPLPPSTSRSGRISAVPTGGQPIVTDLYTSDFSGQRQFAVIVPIIRKGEVAAWLRLVFQPEELAAAYADPPLADRWQFALGDGNGVALVGNGDLAEIGKPLPALLLARSTGSAGLFELPHDDDPLLAAYRRSRVTGWLGFALVPVSSIEAPLVRIWEEFLATGFLLLALSLVASYLLSQTMTRPMQDLTFAAMALGRGEEAPLPHSSLLEANLLANALGQASTDLRERTRALSESERRFRLFADGTSDMIWFLDIDQDRIEYISPAFEQIWGPEGRPFSCMADWRNTVYGDDLQAFDRTASFGDEINQAEYRIKRPDGTIRWVRDTRFVLEGGESGPKVIAGIVRDFTVRREATDAMRAARAEAESRLAELEHLYESSPIGLAAIGPDRRLKRVNDFMARIGGARREDFLGRPFADLLPDIAVTAETAFQQIFASGAPIRGVEFQTGGTHDETVFYWNAHFYPIAGEGGEVGSVGIILEDVTREKLHQQALGRLAAIVYAANDAMFSTSPAGLILNWNPAAETMFRYKPEEAVGRPLSALFAEERRGECASLLTEAGSGEGVRVETEMRRKDAGIVPVSMSIAPIRQDDQVIAISVTIEDITERKRSEERQALMNRELSHRVKNSLAVIQAMARHTLRSSPTPQAFTRAFEGRLQALATSHNLLTDSHWEGADLTDLIRDQLAPTLTKKERIRLRGEAVRLPPGTATSLGLVLHELATNALKFGSLSVPDGRVEIGWTVHGEGKDRTLRLNWQETGGPTVQPPSTKGFGSTLIENSGKVQQSFPPEGLRCTVELGLAEPPVRAF